ncbi:unnamed protein product [Lymnaea stagnalis]|uniref:THD domain-containing protein n=1 Tax=Lymnaea stagnalis TaxID=6523 RepID=A0AAV2I3N8_LYMST
MVLLIQIVTNKGKGGNESTFSVPNTDFQSHHVATHKKLLQATNKDSRFPGDHIYLIFSVNNLPNEYTHGVTVTPHSLITKFTGLYYIYCSIHFHQDDTTSKITNYVTYVTRVSHFNPGGTGVLLKSVHTASHKTAKTTFTGGIFFLQEGDRIKIGVTGSDAIEYKSESTYTGMFLLTRE